MKVSENKLFAVFAALSIAAIAWALFSTQAHAGGFREQKGWQFQTPLELASKIQREQLRLLYSGDYFKGSHANKAIYIGEVTVEDISGNTTLVSQDSTNIGNYSNIVQSGDGTLNVDSAATSGTQGNDADASQLFNGEITSGGRTVLNVSGVGS